MRMKLRRNSDKVKSAVCDFYRRQKLWELKHLQMSKFTNNRNRNRAAVTEEWEESYSSTECKRSPDVWVLHEHTHTRTHTRTHTHTTTDIHKHHRHTDPETGECVNLCVLKSTFY